MGPAGLMFPPPALSIIFKLSQMANTIQLKYYLIVFIKNLFYTIRQHILNQTTCIKFLFQPLYAIFICALQLTESN